MMHQAEKQSEKPMKELLQEQSEELKTYIDLKHKEMEELIAESEGRLCEQIREKSKRQSFSFCCGPEQKENEMKIFLQQAKRPCFLPFTC